MTATPTKSMEELLRDMRDSLLVRAQAPLKDTHLALDHLGFILSSALNAMQLLHHLTLKPHLSEEDIRAHLQVAGDLGDHLRTAALAHGLVREDDDHPDAILEAGPQLGVASDAVYYAEELLEAAR